jgi:hypothetical protein
MVFPNSNLPSTAQPWARDVQKRIETVESNIKANGINNTARDVQLENNYKRIDKTVNDLIVADAAIVIATQQAQDAADDAAAAAATANSAATTANNAINAITSLGTPGSSTIVNASNIQGGTITGINIIGNTIKSAASGARVEVSGTSLTVDGGSGTVATLYGSGSSFFLAGINGSIDIDGTGASISSGANDITVSNTRTTVLGNALFANLVEFTSGINTTGITNNGGISSTGTISTAGGLQRTAYIGGGTTTASVNDTGTFIRTSSSARYKQDISNAEFDYDAVIALQPKLFRLKEEAELNENAIFYPGFIAEEIAGTALDAFVSYQPMPDGTKRPDGVRYAELTAALVSAVKHQDGIIKSLTARIEALESKV